MLAKVEEFYGVGRYCKAIAVYAILKTKLMQVQSLPTIDILLTRLPITACLGCRE
jgi:hypothetical protein